MAAQFPGWAGLPVRVVAEGGWDNRTFRLGDELTVRLPSAARYVAGVAKEDTWLPRLAPGLPLPIPEPVASGAPGAGYPWPWSVRRWLPGRPALASRIGDATRFATDLAAFLRALWAADATGGPAAGEHSFHRGGDLAVYDRETRAAATALGVPETLPVWDAATATRWPGPPVWFHGDVAAGNLLVDDTGRLAAVIDFGTSGVGDPACDLTIAWTLLDGPARSVFRAGVPFDAATWERARGWALWKALTTLAAPDGGGEPAAGAARTLDAVLASRAT